MNVFTFPPFLKACPGYPTPILQQFVLVGLLGSLLLSPLSVEAKKQPKEKETPSATTEQEVETEAAQREESSEKEPDTPDLRVEARQLYNRGVEIFQTAQMQGEKGNKQGQEDLLKQAIKNFQTGHQKRQQPGVGPEQYRVRVFNPE